MTIEMMESLGGEVGSDTDHLEKIPVTSVPVLNSAPVMNNGTVKIPFPGGSEYNGDIILIQNRPIPFTVLSLICYVEIGD